MTESKSLRMTNTALRDRARHAIMERSWDTYEGMADAILAALGLDDLDAAVERGARAVWDGEQKSEAAAQQAEYGNDAGASVQPLPFEGAPTTTKGWYRANIQIALEAALTCSATKRASHATDVPTA